MLSDRTQRVLEVGQAMDVPNEDGHWAFEGRLDGSSVEKLRRCVMVRRNSIDNNFYAFWFGGREFKVSQMIGAWHKLTMPWEVPPPPVGASVPREVAQTMREALPGTRMRAIGLTRWDDAHAARVDAALAWLATDPPSESVPQAIAETIVRWAELLHALVMDTREHNIDVADTLRKEITAVLAWLQQHTSGDAR